MEINDKIIANFTRKQNEAAHLQSRAPYVNRPAVVAVVVVAADVRHSHPYQHCGATSTVKSFLVPSALLVVTGNWCLCGYGDFLLRKSRALTKKSKWKKII